MLRPMSDAEMRQLQQAGDFLRRILREAVPDAVVDEAPFEKLIWDESDGRQVMRVFTGFRVSYRGHTHTFQNYEEGPRTGNAIGCPADYFRVPEGIAEDFADVIYKWCRENGAPIVVGIEIPDVPKTPYCPDCREYMEKIPGGWKCFCVPAPDPVPNLEPPVIMVAGPIETVEVLARGRKKKDG